MLKYPLWASHRLKFCFGRLKLYYRSPFTSSFLAKVLNGVKQLFGIYMKDRKRIQEVQDIPICPTCGQPVKPSFLYFKINEKVKLLFFVLLIGYVILSIFVLATSMPPEMRRGCNRYPPHQLPDRCKDDKLYSLLQPLYKEPVFQVFIGSGAAAGLLIFYWDWLQNIYENWQRKRKNLIQKSRKLYKYECRHCGQQWN